MGVIEVQSSNTRYSDKYIEADYRYETTTVKKEKGGFKLTPRTSRVQFRTSRHVPKVGVMLVGWGGNNGSTVTAAVLANKHNLTWQTKEGLKTPNYFGSLTQVGTTLLGTSDSCEEIYAPFRDLLPLVEPNHLVFGGWDISGKNLAESMERAKVLDYDLQRQLKPMMANLQPLPAIYEKDFIAANQEDRADNVLTGTKWQKVEQIRLDIRSFRQEHALDKVIVLWTANTERFCDVRQGLNDTADNLLKSVKENEAEVSPSTLYAVASILEDCAYINGSPQNTFVPGLVELAEKRQVMIGGDDFKSGQTKIKSVLVDFLIGAGLKPTSIVSYNHLGNNDGKNLSAPPQFRSKEISKSNVVDDMVASNPILYGPGEKPDHTVVIKYVPYVGDSKRAMDEYTSEILLGGHHTLILHNTCEDSLLAAPLILDLILLTEICQRIVFRPSVNAPYQAMHPVLSVLGYLCKAPLVPKGAPLTNALQKQRSCIEQLFRACLGLPQSNPLELEHKLSEPRDWVAEPQEKVTKTQENGNIDAPLKAVNGFSKGKMEADYIEKLVLNGH